MQCSRRDLKKGSKCDDAIFVKIVAVSTVAWPLAARAQQPATPVVGFLHIATAEGNAHNVAGFQRGLAEAGYVEGKNVTVEYHFANFKPELMSEAAADLVRRNVSVIFAAEPAAVVVARNATTSIPVVGLFVRKQLRRGQMLAFFKALPPCLVGMEACATSHYWARELTKLSHRVRLMPAKDVKAYVKRNKNDAADAQAICEAVRRPTMRFVQIKSVEQQGQLMLHRARDLLMRQRTQLINALRAHMAELGIVAAQGREGVKELLKIIATEQDARLPVDAHTSLVVLAGGFRRCRR